MFARGKTKSHVFLSRMGKRLNTDLIYLTKGGFWLSLLQGTTTITSLALGIAFANLIPPYVYGVYKYVLSVGGVLGAFSLSGAGTALVSAAARHHHGALRQAFVYSMLSHIPMSIVSAGIALYYFFMGNAALAVSFTLFAVLQPIIASASLYGSFINGIKDFRRFAVLGSFFAIAPAIAILTTLFLTDALLTIMLVYFLSLALVSVGMYWYVQKKVVANAAPDPQFLNDSVHLSLQNVLMEVAANLDKILVFQYLGALELAIYSFATVVPLHLKSALKNIQVLIAPRFAEHTLSAIKQTLVQKMALLFLATLSIVAVYILLAPFFFKLLLPAYIEAVPYSQVFALSLLGHIAVFPNTALIAHRKTGILYAARAISAIVQIGAIFIGIVSGGLWGAIAARVATKYIDVAINTGTFYIVLAREGK